MTKEELATERNEVREILEGFSEELSQSNLDKLSRVFCLINGDEKCIEKLEKENAELKKNYEDSLVACGVLKARVDALAQPSPLESMQDVLITTQKAQNEKQREQLTEAKEIIKIMKHLLFDVWGYIAIPLEKRVNNFLKQSNS